MGERRNPFGDASAVAGYVSETPKKVPGLADLHRMVTLLLAERADGDAKILVVGAGGGLELGAMAGAQAGWRFAGVDPSAAMLDIARQVTAPVADRIDLVEGLVDAAPDGPFDGATCLLVLHFLERADRLRTLTEIRRRLRPGAALAVAHHTKPEDGDATRWLARSVAFGDRTGGGAAQARASAAMMAERLPLLTPADEEAVLREAGFSQVAMFWAALSFRGWVAVAG